MGLKVDTCSYGGPQEKLWGEVFHMGVWSHGRGAFFFFLYSKAFLTNLTIFIFRNFKQNNFIFLFFYFEGSIWLSIFLNFLLNHKKKYNLRLSKKRKKKKFSEFHISQFNKIK